MEKTEEWRHVDHGANIGQSSAWYWQQMVTMQMLRIREERNGVREIMDAYLLILAMRQVIRGCQMSQAHMKTPEAQCLAQEALDAFDLAVPGGKDARDVIEHFDEYTQGRGNLQQPTIKDRRKRLADEGLATDYAIGWRWDTDDDGRRPVFIVGPYEIDLLTAEDASFRLQCSIYEALLLDEGRSTPAGWAYSEQRSGPLPSVQLT